MVKKILSILIKNEYNFVLCDYFSDPTVFKIISESTPEMLFFGGILKHRPAIQKDNLPNLHYEFC